jgi:predicted lipoprotein with Yx(FWY)xxD motif
MRFRYLAAVAAIGAVSLAACGSGGSSSSNAAAIPTAPVATITRAGVAVNSGNTSLGAVLTSPSGLTMYGLMNDTKTHSTCTGACAMTWPPVLVGKGWTAAPGLDRSEFSTIVRADGTRQLVAGNWPLYTYSGDARPGDVNGEGAGGVWFAVGTNAKFVKRAASSTSASSGY